ncbi:putative membrane protein [Escherichia coli 2-005-03_S1_C2]|nr:putative membrane protein [Escherichia coli DEC3E]EIN47032.1 putative membrane protein [Escherichia coli FRIK1985]EKI44832.1 putative membrane protein [Escherichia coli 07798]EKJ22628.1 putative membrane protein [Escherichia coli EC1865]EKJ63085.1 putative membrane protein [Escherichia coli FRIK523]EKW93621.1 putative membrane protein [Escherichia coli 99.0678]ELV60135.1 putative membrane protein [Escherichia coli 99.1793]ERC05007.1 putative membrane protein [Escherichia coli B28-1]ERD03
MGDYLIYLVMSFIYVMKDIILLITFLVENFSNTLQLFPVVF